MRKTELIQQLELYEGDPEVIFSFEGLDYDNCEISLYNDQLVIDVDLLNSIDIDYLEINE